MNGLLVGVVDGDDRPVLRAHAVFDRFRGAGQTDIMGFGPKRGGDGDKRAVPFCIATVKDDSSTRSMTTSRSASNLLQFSTSRRNPAAESPSFGWRRWYERRRPRAMHRHRQTVVHRSATCWRSSSSRCPQNRSGRVAGRQSRRHDGHHHRQNTITPRTSLTACSFEGTVRALLRPSGEGPLHPSMSLRCTRAVSPSVDGGTKPLRQEDAEFGPILHGQTDVALEAFVEVYAPLIPPSAACCSCPTSG